MKRIISLLLVAVFAVSLFTVTAFADEDRWIVSNVDITVQTPSDGVQITDTYEINPLCEGFYVANVSWDPADTLFKAGVSYSVTITVETENDFTFDSGDTLGVFINERRATILSRSADQMKFGLTFDPVLPNFIDVSYNYSAAQIMLHENFTLEALYTLPAGATNVKHQWYVADTPNAWGEPIEWATGKTLSVPNDEEGTKYYRCHITCEVDGEILSTPTEEFSTVLVKVEGYGMPSMFFDDVTTDDWFYGDVEFVYYNRLMNGTSTNLFSPAVATTRGMIVTILYRLEGSPEVTTACPFSDVPAGAYYEDPIIWAAEKGIVNGVGDGKFAPDDKLTREQLATIFFRFANYKGFYDEDDCVMTGGFKDQNQVSSWAEDAMSWAIGVGLINGSNESDGLYLMPQGNAQRCHVAAILQRFCKYFYGS